MSRFQGSLSLLFGKFSFHFYMYWNEDRKEGAGVKTISVASSFKKGRYQKYLPIYLIYLQSIISLSTPWPPPPMTIQGRYQGHQLGMIIVMGNTYNTLLGAVLRMLYLQKHLRKVLLFPLIKMRKLSHRKSSTFLTSQCW